MSDTAATIKYKAFLSYSHRDRRWARWLHRSLESYRVPRRLVARLGLGSNRISPVFRDRDELPTSASLSDAIQTALAASEYLIVICSPAAASSKWVNEEIRTFISQHGADQVLCLMVDGSEADAFPETVRYQLDSDGVITDIAAEPLAADARPEGDGRSGARLKLIAGMLGVSYGDLRNREQRRRNRTLGIFAVAAIAIAALTTALAVAAFIARGEAQTAREEAETVTEFLSNLMTEVNPEAVGHTITADLRQRVEDEPALFAGQPEVAPEAVRQFLGRVNMTNTAVQAMDEALLRGGVDTVEKEFADRPAIAARLKRALGSGYFALGAYTKADQLLSEARRMQLDELGSGHLQTARTIEVLGTVWIMQGRYEETETLYLDALAEITADDSEWRIHRAALQHNLGIAYTEMGIAYTDGVAIDMERLEEARRLQEAALETATVEFGAESENTLEVMTNLGWTLFEMQDYAAAAPLTEQTLEIKRRVLGDEHPQTLYSINNLALVYKQQGRLDAAEALHREDYQSARRVAGDLHHETFVSMMNLARIINEQERPVDALPLLVKARAGALQVLSPGHPLIAQIILTLADTEVSLGHFKEAVAAYHAGRAVFAQAYGADHPTLAIIDGRLNEAEKQRKAATR